MSEWLLKKGSSEPRLHITAAKLRDSKWVVASKLQ